jgi:hypothetical protein
MWFSSHLGIPVKFRRDAMVNEASLVLTTNNMNSVSKLSTIDSINQANNKNMAKPMGLHHTR